MKKKGLKNLSEQDLIGHEDEKFTDLAVAFRTQVGQLLAPGTGQMPHSLKRMNVRQMCEIKTFLASPIAEFFDRSNVLWVHASGLYALMNLARADFQAEALVTAERWRDYAEVEVESIEVPGWFSIFR